MSEKERRTINDYILEVFHYEHDLSSTILARLLLLCELLVEKGILKDEDIQNKLSDLNVAIMMKQINYGEDSWDESRFKD